MSEKNLTVKQKWITRSVTWIAMFFICLIGMMGGGLVIIKIRQIVFDSHPVLSSQMSFTNEYAELDGRISRLENEVEYLLILIQNK